MSGFLKAIFDPAGILGNWEDTPGGPPPQARPLSTDPHDALGLGGYFDKMNNIKEMGEKLKNHERMQGFMEQMGASSDPRVEQLNQVWEKNAEIKPADWSAQWSYTPGKGPQWVEPKRVSPNNDVPWAPVVNTGPAKGNRF